MRPIPLMYLKEGINRLRVKGGARPTSLYELRNAWVTQDGSIEPREGTIRNATLDTNTVGLCTLRGRFNVFSNALQSVPAGFDCNVLVDPNDPSQMPKTIWFAKPFLGFLYVVCEFQNGDLFHYWLQSNGTWAANTVYFTDNIVLPTTPTGLAYQAVRNLQPYPTWGAQSVTAVNDIIEPTQYTGYVYKAIAVAGAAPHTGSTEPAWPATENATIQEFGDFDTSSTAASTDADNQAQPLGSNITDRYGNSATISNSGGTANPAASIPTASTTVTTWAAGTTYAPGAVVKPSTNQGAFINAIPNGDFENGDDGSWTLDSGVTYSTSNQYQGNFCLEMTADHSQVEATMTNFGLVTPGQSVSANCYVNPRNVGNDLSMFIQLNWYDAADIFISSDRGPIEQGTGYRQTVVTAVAPATAKHCRVTLAAGNGTSPKTGYADLVTWNLETPAAVSNFLYEAIQANAASSGTTEPTWPTISGNTVIDGGVTWKAIGTSIITWEAIPIMKSGSSEPTWPTTVGISVHDGNMSWIAISRQVPTPDPSKAVCIGASHVFNADDDIVDYSAAVDPTDWTSTNNAGYLPTGLNNYGDNPAAMLGLYRSNLMVFNSGGYQMWQIDPDPANMALLDAQPVGSIYTRASQSVANDLLFLTEVGVRNIGTVGASANMQVGGLGQPVDKIVAKYLKAGAFDPISLYYPGRGQYWLIFGTDAIVLTINGTSQKTWSRFVFPAAITDWTLNGEKLYLRTDTNLVWQLDADTLVDDFGGANVGFPGVIQWPYLDLGSFALEKMLIGIDLVGTGEVTIQIGWDQRDETSFYDDPGFATTTHVTAPYTIASADTVPGEPLPIPLNAPSYSPILIFSPNQKWSFEAGNIYVADESSAGVTG